MNSGRNVSKEVDFSVFYIYKRLSMKNKHVHMDNTMMRVSKETRDMLKAIGKKGETYDDIIRRQIEKCK